MDKFYVGAKVVCVGSPTDGAYKKGEIYEVFGVRKDPCLCKGIVIDIGLHAKYLGCHICGMENIPTGGIRWCASHRFRLLEPDIELSETRLDEILDLINANA